VEDLAVEWAAVVQWVAEEADHSVAEEAVAPSAAVTILAQVLLYSPTQATMMKDLKSNDGPIPRLGLESSLLSPVLPMSFSELSFTLF
jgi:hypothetical protein